MEEPKRYSSSFCATAIRQVMNWIEARQCGCLVGLQGAGKSNFVRFLLDEETRKHYLGYAHTDFVFIFLDLLALGEYTDWALYELILDQTLNQLRPLVDAGLTKKITTLHQEITHSKDSLTARRAIEQSLEGLCEQPDRRIILLFDEFDTAFATLEPSIFRYLRAIRDKHKDQLIYLLITTQDLDDLRTDLTALEHFYRLVNRNTVYLGPYDEADARQMIHYLSAQRALELTVAETTRVIQLSGGHASLIKAILSLLWETNEKSMLAGDTLERKPKIQAECQRVWASLSSSEQKTLCALRDDRATDPDMLHRLKRRGLVRSSQAGSPKFFSPLFANFIQQQAAPGIKNVVIHRPTRTVTIDGRQIDNLTELEFEVLCYFCEHHGQVCTLHDLIKAIYSHSEKMQEEVNDGTLQKLISRLRKKIEPDFKRPRYLVTLRGQGYRFNEPGTARKE
jgi:DNA-binding winged helix-turn-helix (wHTH) protein